MSAATLPRSGGVGVLVGLAGLIVTCAYVIWQLVSQGHAAYNSSSIGLTTHCLHDCTDYCTGSLDLALTDFLENIWLLCQRFIYGCDKCAFVRNHLKATLLNNLCRFAFAG